MTFRIALRILSSLFFLALFGAGVSWSQTDVLTANYDHSRTNANLNETILNPANVNQGQFGKLYSLPVDGYIYAQPLALRQVEVPGKGTHNLIFTATMHNTVYAIDADTTTVPLPLWKTNLGPSCPITLLTGFRYTDITPEIGILSTPVIDPATKTMYVVSCSPVDKRWEFYLHALDVTTGKETRGGPVKIEASVPGIAYGSQNGVFSFDAFEHVQRPGLLLLNGVVYIAFGSHADIGFYHGWLIGYQAETLKQVSAWVSTPDAAEGAIWQGGRGITADENGNLYIGTGNGLYDGVRNFGQSIVKVETSSMTATDSFTPYEWETQNVDDYDLGSAGTVLIPGTSLVVGAGKTGILYLLNRNRLGGVHPNDSGAVQALNLEGLGVFNFALWNRSDGPLLYVRPAANALSALKLRGNSFEPHIYSQTLAIPPFMYDGMSVSANGSDDSSGIVWLVSADTTRSPGPGTLRAFDASDLSRELWNSGVNPIRDALGSFAKFANPTVVNGRVYVPTFSNQLVVYGLQNMSPGIQSVVNSASGAAGPVTPGATVTITGIDFGPDGPLVPQIGDDGKYPTEYAGLQVLFDEVPAQLLYASPNQINAIVPQEVAGRTNTTVMVYNDGQNSNPAVMDVGNFPGIFTANSSGAGQSLVINADGETNDVIHPAERGSQIIFYVTGLDLSKGLNAVTSSHATAAKPVLADGDLAVTIDGQIAEVVDVRPAPGDVQGVIQFTVRVPMEASSSNTAILLVQVGSSQSQTNATIAIQ